MILIIRTPATPQQIDIMLAVHKFYIKLAVDVEKSIIAGGGELHADCEEVLLKDGSKQENIWGASWNPITQELFYESLINIRSRQQNRSMEILSPLLREQVAKVTRELIANI
jgi:hypothetical protein